MYKQSNKIIVFGTHVKRRNLFQMEAMRLSYEEKLKKAKAKEGDNSADKLLKKINEDKKTKLVLILLPIKAIKTILESKSYYYKPI
jgi:hypothetical protein